MHFITRTSEVESGLSKLKSNEYFSLDTEFLRTETYYSKLCLMQFAIPGYELILDITTLEASEEWPAVAGQIQKFLSDSTRTSALHAAHQDLEIIDQYFSTTLINIFDTQVAARFLGMPSFPSYGSLIDKYLNIQLDKKFQFCNWSKRPLSKEQLEYAKLDVLHLNQIHPIMLSELHQQGKYEWFCEDMKNLSTSPIHDKENAIPKLLYKTFPQLNSLAEAKICYALIYAREKTAIEFNVARPKILHNDDIVSASQQQRPSTIRSKIPKPYQSYFCTELDIALTTQEECNLIIEKIWLKISSSRYQKTPEFFKAKELLIKLADSHRLSADLIASTDDIFKALAGKKCKITQGWRHELFGKHLTDLIP